MINIDYQFLLENKYLACIAIQSIIYLLNLFRRLFRIAASK